MLPKLIVAFAVALFTLPAIAQQSPDTASTQPQVKVNVLNVCTPSAEEQKEIATALARIPKQPLFGPDFEISHGVSTLTDAPNFLQPGQGAQMSGEPSVARYVRIRREFAVRPCSLACNTRSAMTGRIWLRRSCCTCAIPKT